VVYYVCLQPSSPVDYCGSGESDVKVELTEKLFAPESVATNPTDSQVSGISSIIAQMIFKFYPSVLFFTQFQS